MNRLDEIRKLRTAFANWRRVALLGLAYKQLPLPSRDMRVVTRTAGELVVPLRPNAGALYTVLEVMAFDAWGSLDELPAAPRVLDIGANVGAFSVLLSAIRPAATGLAFEPDPEAFAYLHRNIAGSGMEAREAAVSASAGTARLHRTGHGDGTSSLIAESTVSTFVDQVAVEQVDIADLLESEKSAIDFVKLDCEGAEYEILDRGDAATWAPVVRIALEYHPVEGRTLEELEERLDLLGLSVTSRQQLGPGLGMLWADRR